MHPVSPRRPHHPEDPKAAPDQAITHIPVRALSGYPRRRANCQRALLITLRGSPSPATTISPVEVSTDDRRPGGPSAPGAKIWAATLSGPFTAQFTPNSQATSPRVAPH